MFCLARQYGLLDPEALTPENQAMDVGGHPPWVPNIFSSSGLKIIAYFKTDPSNSSKSYEQNEMYHMVESTFLTQ